MIGFVRFKIKLELDKLTVLHDRINFFVLYPLSFPGPLTRVVLLCCMIEIDIYHSEAARSSAARRNNIVRFLNHLKRNYYNPFPYKGTIITIFHEHYQIHIVAYRY